MNCIYIYIYISARIEQAARSTHTTTYSNQIHALNLMAGTSVIFDSTWSWSSTVSRVWSFRPYMSILDSLDSSPSFKMHKLRNRTCKHLEWQSLPQSLTHGSHGTSILSKKVKTGLLGVSLKIPTHSFREHHVLNLLHFYLTASFT